MRRFAAKAGALLAALLVIVCLAVYAYVRRSLPVLDGELTVPDLSAPVDIVRDADAIPHIFAATERDALYALGYVHAQDRLWQMEFQRRIGHGRLAEFLGERAYDVDRLMRTLGIARLAQRIVARLDAETVTNLEAYAAGVNAYLDEGHVLPV